MTFLTFFSLHFSLIVLGRDFFPLLMDHPGGNEGLFLVAPFSPQNEFLEIFMLPTIIKNATLDISLKTGNLGEWCYFGMSDFHQQSRALENPPACQPRGFISGVGLPAERGRTWREPTGMSCWGRRH